MCIRDRSNNKEIPNSEILDNITESQADYWYVLLIIPAIIGIAIVIGKSRLSANNK